MRANTNLKTLIILITFMSFLYHGKMAFASFGDIKMTHVLERVIQGKVSTSENENLPGVNVVVKGTSIGTITDIDGNYTLSVPDEESILVFSYVGYNKTTLIVV